MINRLVICTNAEFDFNKQKELKRSCQILQTLDGKDRKDEIALFQEKEKFASSRVQKIMEDTKCSKEKLALYKSQLKSNEAKTSDLQIDLNLFDQINSAVGNFLFKALKKGPLDEESTLEIKHDLIKLARQGANMNYKIRMTDSLLTLLCDKKCEKINPFFKQNGLQEWSKDLKRYQFVYPLQLVSFMGEEQLMYTLLMLGADPLKYNQERLPLGFKLAYSLSDTRSWSDWWYNVCRPLPSNVYNQLQLLNSFGANRQREIRRVDDILSDELNAKKTEYKDISSLIQKVGFHAPNPISQSFSKLTKELHTSASYKQSIHNGCSFKFFKDEKYNQALSDAKRKQQRVEKEDGKIIDKIIDNLIESLTSSAPDTERQHETTLGT